MCTSRTWSCTGRRVSQHANIASYPVVKSGSTARILVTRAISASFRVISVLRIMTQTTRKMLHSYVLKRQGMRAGTCAMRRCTHVGGHASCTGCQATAMSIASWHPTTTGPVIVVLDICAARHAIFQAATKPASSHAETTHSITAATSAVQKYVPILIGCSCAIVSLERSSWHVLIPHIDTVQMSTFFDLNVSNNCPCDCSGSQVRHKTSCMKSGRLRLQYRAY